MRKTGRRADANDGMTTHQQTLRPSPLAALARLGTSIWLDSLSRAMIERGELARLVREHARVAFARFRELFSGDRFAALAEHGARVQRPLWASTGVKDERYRDTMYVEELAGPDTVDTMPLATLEAFADHGEARDALTGTEAEARRTLAELRDAGIDLDDVTERLVAAGIEAFEVAMGQLVDSIERRRG